MNRYEVKVPIVIEIDDYTTFKTKVTYDTYGTDEQHLLQ